MDLAQLVENVQEVDIETKPADGTTTARRTTIWPVVDGGEVYVRAMRGTNGRWFQEATGSPDVVLHVAGQPVAVRAVPAADTESVEHANAGYRRKYASSPYVGSMVRPEIFPATLRLDPR
jgi:hypothetical protein